MRNGFAEQVVFGAGRSRQGESLGCDRQSRLFQEFAEFPMGTQEGSDFPLEFGVSLADLTHKLVLLIGLDTQRRLQQIVNPFPAFTIH
jgi:hypothetical protein